MTAFDLAVAVEIALTDEDCRAGSCVVLTSSQRDAPRTLMDEYDFIFVQMLVGRNFIFPVASPLSRRPVRSSRYLGINLENEWLVPKQHPTITFVGLKDCWRRLLWRCLRIWGRCVGIGGTWCRHSVGLSR